MATTEFIYKGRANRIQRQLTKAGAELTQSDKDAITHVHVHIDDVCWDSDVSDAVTVDDGYVILQLGPEATLPDVGQYTARITVFDAAATEGYAWGDFRVRVEDWPECA